MQPRISMITLGVRDMERAVKFYRDGLGFPQMESPPAVAFFTLNGSWLGLYGLTSWQKMLLSPHRAVVSAVLRWLTMSIRQPKSTK